MHVPVKKLRRSELDIDTKTRNVLLRSLGYQGERGFALMSQRWRALQHVSFSPTTIGDITYLTVSVKFWVVVPELLVAVMTIR